MSDENRSRPVIPGVPNTLAALVVGVLAGGGGVGALGGAPAEVTVTLKEDPIAPQMLSELREMRKDLATVQRDVTDTRERIARIEGREP